MATSREPESFRGLLLRHRGRTGLIQRDLAARAGVSLRSVQEWEAGDKFPTAERLQALIQVLLDAGGLTNDHEEDEARELWTAAERDSPRMHTPFDDDWFARLVAARASPRPERVTNALESVRVAEQGTGAVERSQDWGDAPDTMRFVGRADELALLQRSVLDEHCRLVAVLGIGGIGKTSLAARLAQTVALRFERVYWRSLRNAPPVSEWLAGAIGFLSDQHVMPPPSESERINTLLQLLRARRCLLVLDNSETLFEPGQREVRYRADMAGYGRLLQAIGEATHQSCLVLTSREAPPELALLTGVRELELNGLGIAEAQALVADKQLHGDTQTWGSLVDRYGGNGLALKIVGETIRQVYAGDVAAFLADAIASYGAVFGGIRRLLDVQAERLSPVERDVLTRLAVEREPITLVELCGVMAPTVGRNTVVEAIETLRRRSLVERGDRGATFTLQSMVLEYMTDRLVETIADEIGCGESVVLVELPLIKAQAKDYVRETQERLIGTAILQQLTDRYGEDGSEPRLLALLDGWRGRPTAEQGYGPGNVVNLLRVLRGDLRGIDLSRLAIRQAYLAAVDAQGGSLAGAHLFETALAGGFSHPTSVALSTDGAFLAAGSGEVWLWSVADRTALLGLPAHGGMVWAVALTADGRLTASGGGDGTVRLWETKTGRSLAILHGHTAEVWCVALSADGRLVASGGADGTVRLWSLADVLDGSDAMHGTGRQLASLEGHAGTVWRVALSADGQLVASGGGDGTVRLWETSTGRPLMTLQGHTGGVWGVALSADGRLVASCGDDGTVRLWESTSGRPLTVMQGHTGVVWRVALSADGELVASGGEDGTVRLWETRTGRPLRILQGHTNEVLGVALSGDAQLVASSSVDSAVRLWDARTGRPLATLHGNPAIVSDVALSADGALLATKGNRGPQLWETTTGRQLTIPLGRTDGVWRVALSADGQLLAGGFGDGTVCLWETNTGRPLWTRHGHTAGVWGVALSADGGLMASGGGDGMLRLWETSTGRDVDTLQGHAGVVWRVALSADGRLVASGGGDGMLRLWETSTGRPLMSVHGHAGGVFGVALCADGHMLASSGDDGIVRLWESWTGHPRAVLRGHTSVVRNVALSADGEVVASGSLDGVLRVWEGRTGRSLATIQDIGRIHALALSANGHLLISGGSDGTVRMWEANTGTLLRTLQAERRYERLDVTGLTGITDAQRTALLALGAIERSPTPAV